MSPEERKRILNSLKKTRPQNRKVIKPTFLNFTQFKKSPVEAKPVAAAKPANIPTNRMQNNMKAYTNRVKLMVNTKMLDPADPSFRNDVVTNMKNMHGNFPNMLPMYTKNWFVNDIVAKSQRQMLPATTVRKPTGPVKVTTSSPMTHTHRLLEARRKLLGTLRRKKPTGSRVASTRRPVKVSNRAASSGSESNAPAAGGYNMENNSNNNLSNISNSNNNNAGSTKSASSKKSSSSKKSTSSKKSSSSKKSASSKSNSNNGYNSYNNLSNINNNNASSTMSNGMSSKQIKELQNNILKMSANVSIVRR